MNREEFEARLDRAYPGIPEALRSDLIDFAGEVSRCHINDLRNGGTFWVQQMALASQDFLTKVARGNGTKREVIEHEEADCGYCEGEGKVWNQAGNIVRLCPYCQGNGQVPAAAPAVQGEPMSRDREVWRAALTLANNICVQESDRYNDNDEMQKASATAYCAQRIRDWIAPTDEQLAEIFEEASIGKGDSIAREAPQPAEQQQPATAVQGEPVGWHEGYRAAMNEAGRGVRELYVNHQRHEGARLLLDRCRQLEQSFIKSAEAAPQPAEQQLTPVVQVEPVGWQYYQYGRWWNGDTLTRDQRKNIEKNGVRVRNVYAVPQPAEREELVASAPVAAQHRFRNPQKSTPDWSAWQPATITLDRPSWEIDSQGFEVEYRLLYDAPQPAEQQPAPAVAALVEALEEGLRAIGDHHAPDDCYATGPMTGDPFRDLVQCPACSFIAMCDDALAAHRKQGGES